MNILISLLSRWTVICIDFVVAVVTFIALYDH